MLSLCTAANLFDYKAKEETALTVLHQARHQGAHDSSSTREPEDSHPWADKHARIPESAHLTDEHGMQISPSGRNSELCTHSCISQ